MFVVQSIVVVLVRLYNHEDYSSELVLTLLLLVSFKMGMNNAITTAAQNNGYQMMSCCFAAQLHVPVSLHAGGKSQNVAAL